MPYFSLKERRSSSSSDDSYEHEQLVSQQAFWGRQRDQVSVQPSPGSPSPGSSGVSGNANSPSATKALDFMGKDSFDDSPAVSSIPKEFCIPHVEVPVKEVQAPDWHALLFGGKEMNCDENLSVPEIDTYYEDCKLAEDVGLNLLNKYHLPVANGFRELNTNRVTSALRSLQKSKKIANLFTDREKVLAYVLMLDYLACCCQEGNLLPLYQNCKDDKKQYHLDLINCDLGFLLSSMRQGRFTLEQLNATEKLMKSSFDKIPSRFNATYMKNSIIRKISALKSKEASSNPEGPKAKKIKTAVSTSKNWEESSLLSISENLKPKILHSTPSKFDGTRDWTFTSTSELAQQTVTPKSVSSSHFIDTLFASDDDVPTSSSRESKTSSSSPQTPSSKKNFTDSSNTMKNIPEFGMYDDLSDDDLPDIPLNIPKPSSSNLPTKSHKRNGNSTLSEHQIDTNISQPKSSSPYKTVQNTWKFSKYESPTKFLPPRSPMKGVVAKCIPREKQPCRSPLKLGKQRQENIAPISFGAPQEKSPGATLKVRKEAKQQKRKKGSKACKCPSCQLQRYLQ